MNGTSFLNLHRYFTKSRELCPKIFIAHVDAAIKRPINIFYNAEFICDLIVYKLIDYP